MDLNVAWGNQIKILDIKHTQNEPITIKIDHNGKNISLPRLIINIADNVKAKINYVNSTTNGFLNLFVFAFNGL